MPHERPGFQTSGLSWQERSELCPGDTAVYAPDDPRKSRWLGLVHGHCLRRAMRLLPAGGVALDFGCGTGRASVELARRAKRVLAVDITPGMLARTRDRCLGHPVFVSRIDGVRLPFRSGSVDLVWVCGVLRYSLLVDQPRHREIADELYRLVRPGGHVCNVEMYVDRPAQFFAADFAAAGFERVEQCRVRIQGSRFETLALGRLRAILLRRWWATASLRWARRAAEPGASTLRDYFFIYRRPPS